jgi:hypothetical protein
VKRRDARDATFRIRLVVAVVTNRSKEKWRQHVTQRPTSINGSIIGSFSCSFPRFKRLTYTTTALSDSQADAGAMVTHSKVRRKNMSWLRRLVAGLSQRSPGFDLGLVHVGFVVDKVAMGRGFVRVIWFPCQYHSTVALHTHISSGE